MNLCGAVRNARAVLTVQAAASGSRSFQVRVARAGRGLVCLAVLGLGACASTEQVEMWKRPPPFDPRHAAASEDVVGFARAWLGGLEPAHDSAEEPRYRIAAASGRRDGIVDDILNAFADFCLYKTGRVRDIAAFTWGCFKGGKSLGAVAFDRRPSADDKDPSVNVTFLSRERAVAIAEAPKRRKAALDKRLGENGPQGRVMLRDGKALQVVRFGTLRGSDKYVIKTAQGIFAFEELLAIEFHDAPARGGGATAHLRSGASVTFPGWLAISREYLLAGEPAGKTPDLREPFRVVFRDETGQFRQANLYQARTSVARIEITRQDDPELAGALDSTFGDLDKKRRELLALVAAAARKAVAAGTPLKIDIRGEGNWDPFPETKFPCNDRPFLTALRSGRLAVSQALICEQLIAESRHLLQTRDKLDPARTPMAILRQGLPIEDDYF